MPLLAPTLSPIFVVLSLVFHNVWHTRMGEGISRTSNVIHTHTHTHIRLKCQIVRTFGMVAGRRLFNWSIHMFFFRIFVYAVCTQIFSIYKRTGPQTAGYRRSDSDSSEPTFFLVSFFIRSAFFFLFFYCCVATSPHAQTETLFTYQLNWIPEMANAFSEHSHTWYDSEVNGTEHVQL